MWLGITSQDDGPDSHRDLPTRLPGDYHRPGSPTLLRPPSVTRHQLGQNRPKTASNVADFGLGADTAVPEYQPVVHRLRLSASP